MRAGNLLGILWESSQQFSDYSQQLPEISQQFPSRNSQLATRNSFFDPACQNNNILYNMPLKSAGIFKNE
jgi:hypothetical protein